MANNPLFGSWHFQTQSNFTTLTVQLCRDYVNAWAKIENNCLILGRDIFGRVPLYWTKIGQSIWFASELKLLLPLVKSPQVNISALYGYTCFSYVPTPLTPVEGIFAIAAGTEQIWQDIDTYQVKYLSQWRSLPKQESETAVIFQLQTLLKNAVARQIQDIQSKTVGVFLSGGLDSSVIAALLVQAGMKVIAYSLDFSPYGISELPYCEQVANHLNIPLVKVKATPNKIKQALQPTAIALDLPFGDGVTVPLYLLSQAASQDTDIVFNGENGDQLFAGWTNKPIIAASIYNQEDFTEQYLRTFHRLYSYETRVFSREVYQNIPKTQPREWLETALDPSYTNNLLDRLRRATLMLKGAQNIQPRATNIGLAKGLQVRSPFCDKELTEYCFQLPGEYFLRGATEKYILKKAVSEWLPAEIVWREKRGMGVPLTEWCLNELWPSVGYWLNPRKLEAEGRFQGELPIRIILGQLGGLIKGRRIGEILWLLLMWQVWRSSVLGEKAKISSFYNPFWLPYPLWKK